MDEALKQLELEKSRGRIRYYGYCNFGVENMTDFELSGGKPVTNQVRPNHALLPCSQSSFCFGWQLPYNLLWRPIELEILPKARELGLGVLAYSPLQQGLLTGKFHSAADIPEGRRRTRLFNSER